MSRTTEQRTQLTAHEPTHILTETGLKPLARPPLPSDEVWRWVEEAPDLITGIEWSGLVLAGRMEIMIAWGQPRTAAVADDVLLALPEDARQYLEFWQRQVNSGDCWCTSGFIGRQAMELLREGYLLASKTPTKAAFGGSMPTRDQVKPGTVGSPHFVRHMMSEAYLGWISTVE